MCKHIEKSLLTMAAFRQCTYHGRCRASIAPFSGDFVSPVLIVPISVESLVQGDTPLGSDTSVGQVFIAQGMIT